MSPKIWLPISHGGRTRNILIPYAQDIDESQLAEIIEWQKEKTLNELKKLPAKPERVISREEAGRMLREYTEFLKRKKGGEIRRFY